MFAYGGKQKAFLLSWQKSKWQKISICKCEFFFWHLIWNTFCHLDRACSIKTDLQTCNLWTGQVVSYMFVNWFWLNLFYPNGKKFSTSNVKKNWQLQMDIFCHFDFCHRRRNGFKQRRKVNFVVYSWPDAISVCRFRSHSY